MSNSESSTSGGLYPAYLTTEMVGGPRTPIAAERIVIVLGRDRDGRPLELSVVLRKPPRPGRLTLYAICEPPPGDGVSFPRPVVESCPAVNVFQVSVQYEAVSPDEAGTGEELAAMAGAPREDAGARCSFCRRSESEAGLLVEGGGPEGGGGVFICRGCAELSLDIFEQEKQW